MLSQFLRPTVTAARANPAFSSLSIRSIQNQAENMSSAQQDPRQEENKTVPSEQITEEAKKAEPDAAEQAEKLEKAGESVLPTIT
ncbi:hypothetical protein IAU60_005183 [Kwoniella sp. DSM 27419]